MKGGEIFQVVSTEENGDAFNCIHLNINTLMLRFKSVTIKN